MLEEVAATSSENEPPDQIFSPLSWQLDETSVGDDNFIGLIILSANHRAGSTLLQRICNARPETLIWGEHNAMLTHFESIYSSISRFMATGISDDERKQFFEQGENPNLWIANMCPDIECAQRAIVESVRAFLRVYYSPYREGHDIIGFKEVQYNRGELELLRKCYPESDILMLVRNPLDTRRSTPADWYPSLQLWMEMWNDRVACFKEYDSADSRCHLIKYEDLISKEKNAIEIVLDTAKITREQFDMVVGNKLGGSRGEICPDVEGAIREVCREMMAAMGYN